MESSDLGPNKMFDFPEEALPWQKNSPFTPSKLFFARGSQECAQTVSWDVDWSNTEWKLNSSYFSFSFIFIVCSFKNEIKSDSYADSTWAWALRNVQKFWFPSFLKLGVPFILSVLLFILNYKHLMAVFSLNRNKRVVPKFSSPWIESP